jgi:hypothetical protein
MSRLFLFAPLLWMLASSASAEVLLLDAIEHEPPNSSQGMLRPHNGQSMATVEAQFGKPQASRGPVGDPPITSWDYPDYTVYFEHNLVITSVVHR